MQTAACLSYIQSAACVTFYVINSPFIMRCIIVVLEGFVHFRCEVTASEGYPDICILQYVCYFAYLWGNECKYCSSFVLVRVRVCYGALFPYALSGVEAFVLMPVGNHYVGLCVELLSILFLGFLD